MALANLAFVQQGKTRKPFRSVKRFSLFIPFLWVKAQRHQALNYTAESIMRGLWQKWNQIFCLACDFLTLISPFSVQKNSDVLCQIRWFSVFPAWNIFSHEAVRLLTFKVKCNKMGSGKFWAWHVATCTLCTSWNVGGILRTYEHLRRMVQTCCTWWGHGELWPEALFLQPPSCRYGRGASTEPRAPSKPCPQHGWARDLPKQLRSCSGVPPDSSGRWSAQSTQQLKNQQCPGHHEQGCWEQDRGHHFAPV